MGIRSFNVADLGQVGLLNPTKMGYRDSLEIIKDESFKIQKSFVKIGWYLKHIRDDELYKADGYENIYACAAEQLGYAQSTVSRLINICEKFSKDHNSPELDEKYSGFDKSQMIEMLPMSSEQLEKVTPDMTVKQIREVNKETKAVKEPNDKVKRVNELVPVQEEQEEKYMPEDYSNSTEQQNTNNDYATSHKTEENIVDVVYKELPEKVSAYGLSKSVYPEESLIATEGCGTEDILENEDEENLREKIEELADGVKEVFWGWEGQPIPKEEVEAAKKNAIKLSLAIEKLLTLL